ncbi:MAG: squalene synthase HpnC [Bdellovibrionota bacterium]
MNEPVKNLKSAFEACSEAAMTHYENFPVGSRWIKKEIRPHMHAVYLFSRTADDFADEPQFEGQRLELLSAFRSKLNDSAIGKASDPVFQALAHSIEIHKLPIPWLDQLIQAFEQDVVQNRHKDFASILDYSKRSANPVGRLVLWLHGVRDEHLFELSDFICTALQLANFWQDVAIDLKKDRVYLPLEDMAKFGYSEKELFAHTYNETFRNLLAHEVKKTWELFEKGRALCDLVEPSLRKELRLVYAGGTTILKKIEAVDYDVFNRRPKLGMFDKLTMLWQMIFWKPSR